MVRFSQLSLLYVFKELQCTLQEFLREKVPWVVGYFAGACVCVRSIVRSYLTLRIHGLYSPVGSSVHGTPQAGILEWVAISCSRGSFQLRDWTQVSSIAGRVSTIWATREALSLASPALAGDSFYHCATWEAHGVDDKAGQFTQRKAHLSRHDLIWNDIISGAPTLKCIKSTVLKAFFTSANHLMIF